MLRKSCAAWVCFNTTLLKHTQAAQDLRNMDEVSIGFLNMR